MTNRHVVVPKIQGREIPPAQLTFRFRKRLATGDFVWEPVSLSGDEIESAARFHPDRSVDVTIVRIYDLLKAAHADPSLVTPYLVSPLDGVSTSGLDVYAGSDIVVVGYPKGFYDDVALFPIVKAGIVASRWGVRFRDQLYFLIDAKLFPGSSGSIVLTKPSHMVMQNKIPMYTENATFAFLGVFSAEPTLAENPVEVGDWTIVQRTGFNLGVVWYAEVIEQIIDDGIPLQQALS